MRTLALLGLLAACPAPATRPDPCAGVACGHGSCISDGVTATCACLPGFAGAACAECAAGLVPAGDLCVELERIDFGPCAAGACPEPGRGACVAAGRMGHACLCEIGFAEDDGACVARPPCSVDEPCEFPVRGCSLELRYTPPAPATTVQVAGEFSDWTLLPMSGPDAAGAYTFPLAPGPGLVAGERVAYKLIVDGAWVTDPEAALRKYSGGCLNSAFALPTCAAGPEIRVTRATATAAGEADLAFTLARALDGSPPTTARVVCDGWPVPAAAASSSAASDEILVHLEGLAAGKHRCRIDAADALGRAAAPVDLPLWVEERPFSWQDATVYLLFLDRFANGDPANDDPEGIEAPADWHGGDLEGALAVLESGYFEALGVNTIWLSPVNAQASGAFSGSGGHLYSAYHGYWPVRADLVEPRLGGDAALHAFVAAAHRRGIRVLLDLINNQVHEQHERYLAHPGWFRTGCVCGVDPGCGWSERPLDCLFAPYLPDINWLVPEAEAAFIADAVAWVDRFDVDGFRIDAVKHVEPSSIYNLRDALARRFERGGARVVMLGETAVSAGDSVDTGCGEVYSSGYAWIDAVTGPHALDGQFDFPTHHRLGGVLDGTLGYDAAAAALDDAASRYRPGGLHVAFLGSHDTARLASRAAADPAVGCSWLEGACTALPGPVGDPAALARLRRAFTLLLTGSELPMIYSGDEVALPGGGDPDSRRDMPLPPALAAVALGGAPDAAGEALRAHVAALGVARRDHPALRHGARVVLVAEPELLVLARATADELVIVALARDAAASGRTLAAAGLLGATTGFDLLAGAGALGRSGDDVVLDLAAGESAVFLGR